MKRILVAAVCSLVLFSCSKKDYKKALHDPLLYSKTVHELNVVVMGNNFSPIVASRNYMYAAVAGYEAIAAGYPDKYYSLAGQIHGLDKVPKPEAGKPIDFEFVSLLAYCKLGETVTFPAGSMKEYVDELKKMATDGGMPADEYNNSLAYADSLSAAIIAWSKKDNYLQTRTFPKYTAIDSPGYWVRTPPMYADAMEPYWSKIRTVVIDSAHQFNTPAPPAFNVTDTASKYYHEVMLIKQAVENLDDEQRHIAEFWDDNPFRLNTSGHANMVTKKFSPPGHWMGIIGIGAKDAHFDFAETTYAFAATSLAMFDSFVFCWDEKYRRNTIRPESVINRYFDADWKPFLQTPPFPEYLCGHSTVSATAAEVLTNVFGDNFNYTDTTELEFGIKSRSYKSFREAAIENNSARFYGGIHFHNSCLVSTEYGKKIGDLVVQRLKFKK
jgi:hypothetical protein